MSNAQFKKDFAAVLKKAGEKSEAVVRAGALEILKRVIVKSPVGDASQWKEPESAPKGYVGGRFKANWNVSIGLINFDNQSPPDKSGGAALSKGISNLSAFSAGRSILITNSLPYARRIEYDAWSKQASAGVVRISVIEYKNIIQQVAAQIK